MRQALLGLLLATAFASMAQTKSPNEELKKLRNKRVTNYAITGTMVLLSGASDGINQALMYQYAGFKRSFPNACDQFWKPSMSGANKYRNGDPKQGAKFPGSRTWLVFVTDGYHLSRFSDHLFMAGALAVKVSAHEKKKWYMYVLEAAGYWVVNRVGFSLAYNHFKCYP